MYRGEDCVKRICDQIMHEAHRLYHMFPEKPIDPLTNGQWKRYKKMKEYHICCKPFNSKDSKVRDHCHYTGSYRGPAHMYCNLRYRIPHYIPVVFYNLSGYDAPLFIKELGAKSNDIDVIAKKKEDYITFSVKVMVDRYMDKDRVAQRPWAQRVHGDERDRIIKLQFIVGPSSFKSIVLNLWRLVWIC